MGSRLNSAFWTLRIAFGLTAFLAGLNKFLCTSYASVVDHMSSDASFVPAALVRQSAPNLLRQQILLQRRTRGSQR